MIGGVCGGLARTLGIDPVVVRVIVAVLGLLGGAGVAAYIIAWILIPDDDGTNALQDAKVNRSRGTQVLLVVVLAAAALSLLDNAGPGLDGGLGFLIFVLVCVVAWQAFGSSWMTSTSVTHDASTGGPSVSVDKGSQTVTVQTPAGTTVIRKEPKSILGRVVWNLLAVAIGSMIALNWADITDIGPRVMLVVALTIVGLGLIVSAFAGRARGLIALGLLLGLLALPAGHDVDGSVGDRIWAPASVAALPSGGYGLGVGNATLDLAALAASMLPGDRVSVDAHVNIGELVIVLPVDPHSRGTVDAQVRLGEVRVRGEQVRSGADSSLRLTYGSVDGPVTIDVRASVDIGQITIRDTDGNAVSTSLQLDSEVSA